MTKREKERKKKKERDKKRGRENASENVSLFSPDKNNNRHLFLSKTFNK